MDCWTTGSKKSRAICFYGFINPKLFDCNFPTPSSLFYMVISHVYYFSHVMNFCCRIMLPQWFCFRKHKMCQDALVPRPQMTLPSKE